MVIEDFFARYCDRCVHSHLDPARGMICGVTGDRPDRTRACDDLVIDVEREEDVLLRQRLNARVDQYRALDDESATLNPYPDPQGAGPRGRARVITYLLTAILVVLVAGVMVLRWYLED